MSAGSSTDPVSARPTLCRVFARVFFVLGVRLASIAILAAVAIAVCDYWSRRALPDAIQKVPELLLTCPDTHSASKFSGDCLKGGEWRR